MKTCLSDGDEDDDEADVEGSTAPDTNVIVFGDVDDAQTVELVTESGMIPSFLFIAALQRKIKSGSVIRISDDGMSFKLLISLRPLSFTFEDFDALLRACCFEGNYKKMQVKFEKMTLVM